MRWFASRPLVEREHLVQALRSLGPTSVAGLAAALSWSPRKTARTVREAVRWGHGAIRFDPASGSVSFRAPEPPARPATVAAPSVAEPAPEPTPPTFPKSWGASAKCPACQVALVSTGTGNSMYCPDCGRLTAGNPGPASSAPPTATSPSVPPAPHTPAISGLGPDRRSQELFAAWVTARPIPCPKCRTPLRHHGVARYACPSCGTQVSFGATAGASNAPPPLPTHAMAPPAPPAS